MPLGIAFSIAFLYANGNLTLALVIASIVLNFSVGRYLQLDKNRRVYVGAIVANLAILGYFKYSIFIKHTLLGFSLSGTWMWALPLGLSFFTFQQIAFLSDVYHKRIGFFSLKNYAMFILFFPHYIAGPIVNYRRVFDSYERWPTFNARSIRFGLLIFMIGILKKLIADFFAPIANTCFANQSALDMYGAWAGMMAFTFQIYFDFSGYCDMAVGTARVFGVSMPYNFNSPYKSRSVAEFWHRWHITLSNWLRDFLYIPLGGSRHGTRRTMLALMLTMTLGGLWHGAGWAFIVWGFVHGAALIIHRYSHIKLPAAAKTPVLFVFVALTWVLFRSETLAGAIAHYQALFNFGDLGIGAEIRRLLYLFVPLGDDPLSAADVKPNQIRDIAAMLVAGFICFRLQNSQRIALRLSSRKVHILRSAEIPVLALLILILSMAFANPDTTNAFIYFQF
nr:MBOAT family O-acyltransferase [Bradyrhizobium elkanii]